MISNRKKEGFKQFKLTRKIGKDFLCKSFSQKISQQFFEDLRQRLKDEDRFFAHKIELWSELKDRELLLNEVDDLIHRQCAVNIARKEGPLFQQLFANETPLPAKRISSVQFKDDTVILQYAVDQSAQSGNEQRNFDRMMYAPTNDKSSHHISALEEEEDNVKIDLKLSNWIENYFLEGEHKPLFPSYYVQIYLNLAISLAFFYKFLKNIQAL